MIRDNRQELCYVKIGYPIGVKEKVEEIMKKLQMEYDYTEKTYVLERNLKYLYLYIQENLLKIEECDKERYINCIDIDKNDNVILPVISIAELESFIINHRGQIAMNKLNLI